MCGLQKYRERRTIVTAREALRPWTVGPSRWPFAPCSPTAGKILGRSWRKRSGFARDSFHGPQEQTSTAGPGRLAVDEDAMIRWLGGWMEEIINNNIGAITIPLHWRCCSSA
jgi:hypothetical protein